MLDDLVPIVADFEWKKDVFIHPVSDIHYGSPQFNETKWTDFIGKYAGKPNHYFFILGDCMNNGLKSSVSNVYEELCSPKEQKAWLVEQFKPIREQIICGVGGNHERRSVKEVDSDPLYDVFNKLDIENRYRANAAFVIMRIGHETYREHTDKHFTYTACVTHGAGNGMYIGSSANKVERFGMAIDGLDLLVTGHTHKPLTFPSRKLIVDPFNKQVRYKQFQVVVATSWLDYGGYPIQKLMTPTAFTESGIILHSDKKNITVIQQ